MDFAHQVKEIGNLFYSSHSIEVKKPNVVLCIDSGCSNHMTSRKDLLVDININVKAKVQASTGVLVEVVGKRTLVIETIKSIRYKRK